LNHATLPPMPAIKGDLSDSRHLVWAFTLSILMHLFALQLIPLLERYKPKPINTIMAEFKTLPPSIQQALESPQPTPPLPEVVQPAKPVIKQPLPVQSKPEPLPILQSESEAQPDDYVAPKASSETKTDPVPSAPQQMETSAPATPVGSQAEAVENSPATDAWDDSEYDEYGRNLQRLCERNKHYPAIAVRRNWQGSGLVLVKFLAGGKLISVTIERSTGQQSLDNQALEMVRKSLSDLPLPNQMKGRAFKISVPVDFRLE